jgi:hypothetical protein
MGIAAQVSAINQIARIAASLWKTTCGLSKEEFFF